MTTIRNVEGSHLTATDIRNIKAVLAQPKFVEGETYVINGRKQYALTSLGGGQWEVAISAWESTWNGRVWRTYKSTFTLIP